MTAHTEGRQVIFQKMIPFGRSMRIVTPDTSFFHRTVLELCFGNGIPDIFVAIKTEFIPCFQKDKFVLGGMGIMALYTIAFHYNFVAALGIFRHDPFMTFIADFVRIFAQQLSVGRGVRIMTFRAFSRLHRSVHKWVFEFFPKMIMTPQAQLPLGIRFQLEFALGV
jgi:hypothetical protein